MPPLSSPGTVRRRARVAPVTGHHGAAACGPRVRGTRRGHADGRRLPRRASPRESDGERWPAASDPQTPSRPGGKGPPGFGCSPRTQAGRHHFRRLRPATSGLQGPPTAPGALSLGDGGAGVLIWKVLTCSSGVVQRDFHVSSSTPLFLHIPTEHLWCAVWRFAGDAPFFPSAGPYFGEECSSGPSTTRNPCRVFSPLMVSRRTWPFSIPPPRRWFLRSDPDGRGVRTPACRRCRRRQLATFSTTGDINGGSAPGATPAAGAPPGAVGLRARFTGPAGAWALRTKDRRTGRKLPTKSHPPTGLSFTITLPGTCNRFVGDANHSCI